ARRLATRATFMPCSASGIAHPRITSSISRGSIPGARFRASAMAAAASSSGRVPRSVPPGALPAAVRTADTITASCIRTSRGPASEGPVFQQIFNRVCDLGDLPVEQMVRPVNDDQLFRLCGAKIEAQYRAADAAERLGRLIDDLRVHRAAVSGVRVAEHDRRSQAFGVPDLQPAVGADAARCGLVEERFEPAGQARNLMQRHAVALRRTLAAARQTRPDA